MRSIRACAAQLCRTPDNDMPTIKRLTALEILDSRGRPTVQATCALAGGVEASVSVPSGASTGAAEALELRDGELGRYRGLGCRRAVAHINDDIHTALVNAPLRTRPPSITPCSSWTAHPTSHAWAPTRCWPSRWPSPAPWRPTAVPLYQHFADILSWTRAHMPASIPCRVPRSTCSAAASTPAGRSRSRMCWSCRLPPADDGRSAGHGLRRLPGGG